MQEFRFITLILSFGAMVMGFVLEVMGWYIFWTTLSKR